MAEDSLLRLEAAVAHAEGRLPPHLVRQRRSFGEGGGFGNHTGTYVHEEFRLNLPDLLQEAKGLVLRADEEAGWNLTARGARQPRLRCAEALESLAGPGSADEADDAHLGWHDDGQTLVTLVLLLSSAGADFEGGEVEVRRHVQDVGDGQAAAAWRASGARGDAIAWRGWDEHRVQPVRRGRRRVLVLEWWLDSRTPPPNGRPLDSEEGMREALGIDPDSPVLHLSLATALHAHARPMEADTHFRHALRLGPAWERTAGELGMAMASLGKYDEAELLLRAAAGLRPDSAHPHIGLAQIALDLNNQSAALGHLQAAVRANPRDAAAHGRLGELQTDAAEAEASFRLAVRLAPLAPGPHHRLGLFQAEQGELEGAERSLRESIRVDPQSPAHFDLGVLLGSQGDVPSAAESYRAAIRANPTDVRPHVNLGVLLGEVGKPEAAEKRFKAALRVSPRDLKALQQLAEAQAQAQDLPAAVKTLKAAARAHPGEARVRMRLGIFLWDQRAPSEEVLEHLTAAARLAPDDDEAHYNLGLYHDTLGDTEEAVASLRAALALNPADEECRDRLEALLDGDEEEEPSTLYDFGGEPSSEDDDSLFEEL